MLARMKISVSALKDIEVLYKGDIYDLACLLLKINDAKDKGANTISRDTVYGLSGTYATLSRLDRRQILAIFEWYNLPLGATVEYDQDVK